MKALFRRLILLELALYLLHLAAPYFSERLYGKETLRALSWNGYGGMIDSNGWFPYAMFGGEIVALLAMYLFQDWGRATFLALLIVSVLLSPFYGVVVYPGWEGGIGGAMAVLAGFLICMAYCTQLNEAFD